MIHTYKEKSGLEVDVDHTTVPCFSVCTLVLVLVGCSTVSNSYSKVMNHPPKLKDAVITYDFCLALTLRHRTSPVRKILVSIPLVPRTTTSLSTAPLSRIEYILDAPTTLSTDGGQGPTVLAQSGLMVKAPFMVKVPSSA